MSKPLADRLDDAKKIFDEVVTALGRLPKEIPTELKERFQEIVDRRADVENWHRLLEARESAFHYLDGLETRVREGKVKFGDMEVEFQIARLLGVQAYLATKWALADSVVSMVGTILCTTEKGQNRTKPAQLVTHFIATSAKESTDTPAKSVVAAPFYYSVRMAFGFPVVVAYSIRNQFIHEGGYRGADFFEGATPESGFRIADGSWKAIVQNAQDYGRSQTHNRHAALWPDSPRDDLRKVFRACEAGLDDVLGILIGSASQSLKHHVAFILGED